MASSGGDAAVLLLAGSWLEVRAHRVWLFAVLLSFGALGLILGVDLPRVDVYAGLSGIGAAIITALGCELISKAGRQRIQGGVILGMIMIKLSGAVGLNRATSPLLPPNVAVAHWAHITGALAGLLGYFFACSGVLFSRDSPVRVSRRATISAWLALRRN